MSGLAKRAPRLALAYTASAVASTIAVMLAYAISNRLSPFDLQVQFVGALVCGPSAPVAWLPLSLFVRLTLALRCPPLVACLLAGAATGVALEVWVDALLDPVFNPFGGGDGKLSWSNVASEFPQGLPIAVPSGLIGGLVFWAVYFRRSKRAGATPALEIGS